MDEFAIGATFAEHVIRGVAGRGGATVSVTSTGPAAPSTTTSSVTGAKPLAVSMCRPGARSSSSKRPSAPVTAEATTPPSRPTRTTSDSGTGAPPEARTAPASV